MSNTNRTNLINQIAGWLGFGASPNVDVLTMREALDNGRRAKRAENYDQALLLFETAEQKARTLNDPMAVAVISLHRADVQIVLGHYDKAESILTELQQDAQNRSEPTQLAYVNCSLGTLEQKRENWAKARAYYEEAMKIGERAEALGAQGRAMGHLADTYLHENNASYAVHLLREALPKLNTSGDIELSSYFVGKLGEALIATGQENEGLQLLNRGLRLAEHMSYRSYERMWRLTLGNIAFDKAAYQDAYLHFKRALSLFETLPASAEQVKILCLMSKTCLHLMYHNEALTFAQRAQSVSQMANHPKLTPLVEGTLGIVLRTVGRSAEAIPYLESVSRTLDTQENAETNILRHLAAAQADNGDVEKALATYQQAIAQAEKLNNPLELAQTRHDLGLIYAQKNQLQDAIDQWTAALKIYEEHSQYAPIALLYCDIGNARKQMGHGQRALRDYEQALMMLNSVDDQETRGIVLSNAANAYVDQGDIESAEAFFTESIEIAQKLGQRQNEATRRGNYGWFLLSTNRLQRAENELNYALRLSKELNLPLQIAVQTDNQGLLQSGLNKHEAALKLHEEALEKIQELKNPYWEAIIKANLAQTRLALGKNEEARILFDSVLAAGRELDNIEVKIRGLNGLADVALKSGQPKEAEEFLTEAIALARKADIRRLKAEALALQSEQQAALGRAEQAHKAWEDAKKLFAIIRAPQAKITPSWLNGKTTESPS